MFYNATLEVYKTLKSSDKIKLEVYFLESHRQASINGEKPSTNFDHLSPKIHIQIQLLNSLPATFQFQPLDLSDNPSEHDSSLHDSLKY
jgi:hypothetical protein